MKKILTHALIFLIALVLSCKDKSTNPPDNYPPGYQHDIPWPSLANSPWPANHADMQRTGRSKYIGPQNGVIVVKVPAPQMQTGVVFGNDSVFYYGTSSPAKLVAAKIDGTILWVLNLNAIETTTTPLVDSKGTIYIANGGRLSAVNPDGTIKWEFVTGREICTNLGLGIDKDGTIYAITFAPMALGSAATLYAIKQDGSLFWKIQNENFHAGMIINLAFSPDGKTMYIQGSKSGNKGITVVGFDIISQLIKWKFGNVVMLNGPLVDYQGNIYILVEDDTLNQNIANFYCLDPNGNIRWKFPHSRGPMYANIDPTIDKQGNVYFATDTLYALDYYGKLRWKLDLGYGSNYSPLICDNEGTIYVATAANFYDNKILAISRDGVIKWILPITDETSPGLSPAITKGGIMVYPTFRSENLFIIR